jgi:hypothetical protein
MSKSISDMMGMIETVFVATQKIVDNLDDQARIGIGDLTQMVSKATGMNSKDIFVFVNYYAHNIEPIAYVRSGKNGGLIKGSRIIKK